MLDNEIFGLDSALGLGKGCLRVVFNWKYFNNAIHDVSRMFLIIQRKILDKKALTNHL